MASFTFNIAKGRVVEYYNRVKSNDPAASQLVLIPLAVGTTAAEAQDYDNINTFLGGTANEQAAGNWVRKPLADADLAAFPAPNDTDNRYDISVPQVTWSGPAPSAGNNTAALVIGYAADGNTATGNDANIVPLTYHDFAVTADGNDVVLNSGNFFQAS